MGEEKIGPDQERTSSGAQTWVRLWSMSECCPQGRGSDLNAIQKSSCLGVHVIWLINYWTKINYNHIILIIFTKTFVRYFVQLYLHTTENQLKFYVTRSVLNKLTCHVALWGFQHLCTVLLYLVISNMP